VAWCGVRRRRIGIGHDLVVVAVHHQYLHRDLQVFGKFGSDAAQAAQAQSSSRRTVIP
jgi:hypothetical protein